MVVTSGYLVGLEKFLKDMIMQTDENAGLKNFLEFSQFPSCLYKTIKTQTKSPGA